uniref:Cell death inducing DFFA like effector c n=1 Tax=Lepisosteus oculatus TaxID=7918 RepID=W5NBD2_LEPOC|nr:PREDICTED: cell death activator CIDE-3 [Lepisosteus oculatus]XP_015203607.1 PREDICTED: cell death activator CIDE-3 [Lepisosteus oculatus]XP_015203609.1 PREDICTED: cell death activator CIDE-3 [Lepisosteus oculatus]XP_015203610.1 PREDICTED: cell death activator CIDE-3 [Lepisosteus oculatus]
MEYAMKSLSLLSTKSLSRCVSASASMTQQLLAGPAARPRPFRVASADRSVKKGIMADGLRDLLDKVRDALHMPCVSALVLDEDGTVVDTEEFFQTLDDNTVFMALDKGEKWTPAQSGHTRLQLSDRPKRRKDVARITFDLYKSNPRDFIGCLNVKATLYGMYSISYDLRCHGAKKMLKEALRWTLFVMQATGHVLLGTSCYMQQLLDEEEIEAVSKEPVAPPKHVQTIQWRKTGV